MTEKTKPDFDSASLASRASAGSIPQVESRRVLVVCGTRPEGIKLAPVIKALADSPHFSVSTCVTAQHREMLDQVLKWFGIKPEFDLDVMREGQDLNDITNRVLTGLSPILKDWAPDWVMVQGDTTTAFAASLTSFYNNVPVAHIEAGLRTGNLKEPWPEEMNRRLISQLGTLHFAPTDRARQSLLRENIPNQDIHVCGNTVVDALLYTTGLLERDPELRAIAEAYFPFLDNEKRIIMVTAHRRENHGDGLDNICLALQRLAKRGDVQIVFPVHLSPKVQEPVGRILGGIPDVHLIDPLDYLSFVYLMEKCHLILTDSGGVQEEAPSLGKPVLVMRNTTERPEATEAGTARLVGTNVERIVAGVEKILDHPSEYAAMAHQYNPFGDGKAAQRIVRHLLDR